MSRMKKIGKYIRKLINGYRSNRKMFVFYSILRTMVFLTMIRSIVTGNYENVWICLLSLALFLLPGLLEDTLKIEIPPLFEGIIFGFIFAAEILGEIDHYYVRFPGWDTILHTMNGFLCAAIGFSMVYVLNRSRKEISLSPFYLTLVAFCFSMTIGVMWEFFECGMDMFFSMDMQKDFIVRSFSSVTLDPANSGTRVLVKDIIDTVIHTGSGTDFTVEGGYLDIGILDTMKDLFVNLIGAVVFSVIGYFTLRNEKPSKITDKLTIKPAYAKPEEGEAKK